MQSNSLNAKFWSQKTFCTFLTWFEFGNLQLILFLISDASSNPLLEFCLDGGFKFWPPPISKPNDPFLPKLLQCCSTPNDCPSGFNLDKLEQLIGICQSQDCDINVQDWQGSSALHLLIRGCTKDSFCYTLQGIYVLLSKGIDVYIQDEDRNSAFTLIETLLQKSLFNESVMLAQVLHQAHSSINHRNKAGRTLLSYSVTYGDNSLLLTRYLLNSNAEVWPDIEFETNLIVKVKMERELSAFTWFLRTLMQSQNQFSNFEQTLYLLGQCMGQKPKQMQTHVTRVMLHLGHSFTAMKPLYLSIRDRLSPYWSQPQSLKYQCLKEIRKAIGPKKLSDQGDLNTLDIPNAMLKYLILN